jgi:hypothetical protein
MSDTAARIITIIGLVFCGIGVAYLALLVFTVIALMAEIAWIPFASWLIMDLLIFSVGYFIIGLVTGLILPGVAYGKINENSKNSAAAILIVCGIIDFLLVSLIGGILLLVGGIIAAVWKPFGHEEYRPSPVEPSVQYPPSTTPTSKLVTTQPEPSPPEGKAFCTYCGAKLSGGERYCPSCGASVD